MNEPSRTRCGMRCDICPAFEANRSTADLKRASKVWAELFDVHLPPEAIICGGCLGSTDDLLDRECPVRPCVLSKGFADCGRCGEMPCEKLKRRWVSRQEIEAKLGRPIQEDDYQMYVLPFENAPFLTERRKKGRS